MNTAALARNKIEQDNTITRAQKLKQIMHADKKQQQTVHTITSIANKIDSRPNALSFLTSVVLQ